MFRCLTCFVLALISISLGCELATAQNTRQLPSTVQLPTFNSFGYSGSVLVPVQGGTYLGGVSRSATGRNRGRSFGGAASHSGASAHVTIIDHDAIDRQIRGLPPKNSSSQNRRSFQVASSKEPVSESRRAAAERVAKAAAKLDEEGKALVRYARKLYREGRTESAYGAYQLAIAKLSPDLARLARAEMLRVFPKDLVTR